MILRAHLRSWRLLPASAAQHKPNRHETDLLRCEGAWKWFVRGTHAAATSLMAVLVAIMAVGGGALITEHVWLLDQRDTLKAATDAASIATTQEMGRLLDADHTLSDDALRPSLESVARAYIEANLLHLSGERLQRAKDTLAIGITIDRGTSRVQVTAETDLGGGLFAGLGLLGGYTGPETMQASTAVECAGNAIEVVLALDVTASMHGAIDKSKPARGDNRRLNAVVKAAKALINELGSTCDEGSVAVGIVPWDKTVRLPNAATWQANSWVNIGDNRTGTIPSDWAGCVEDREHDANPLDATALASATSMSLDLPATSPFPVFIYPDTGDFSVTPMADSIKADFPDLADDIKDALETRLEALRDNDYGPEGRQGRGGGNYGCTSTGMLPLTTTLSTVETTLDNIETSEVMGGGTMAHLGVTWGRRMLAHSWRTVWGPSDSVHPINPADREVTKVLVLLTDGGNALGDSALDGCPEDSTRGSVGVPDCLGTAENAPAFVPARRSSGRSTRRSGGWGRGRGRATTRPKDTTTPAGALRGTSGGGSRTTETALSALMKRSCTLARGEDEGVTVYTIGAMPSVHTRWREALVKCSGAPGTAEADRSAFYFEAADGAALDRAFRAIARRVITFRRVS